MLKDAPYHTHDQREGLVALLGEAVELPTCAGCLERLDPSVTGVFTIVCNHSFHCDCLRRWADATCPVCRHVQDERAESARVGLVQGQHAVAGACGCWACCGRGA